MLTMFEIQNSLTKNLMAFPLRDTSNGYEVRGIDGLGPVKSTLTSTRVAVLPGSQFQSAHTEERDVIIRLGLDSSYIQGSVRDLRRELYGVAATGQESVLNFYLSDTEEVLTLTGVVEDVQPTIFGKDTEVAITIRCFQPYFRSKDPIVVEGTIDKGFGVNIDYKGDVAVGYTFAFTRGSQDWGQQGPGNPPTGFQFQNYVAGSLNLDTYMNVTHQLTYVNTYTINTTPGKKDIVVNGSDGSILSSLDFYGSKWGLLQPGNNKMTLRLIVRDVLTLSEYTLTYYNEYGGI